METPETTEKTEPFVPKIDNVILGELTELLQFINKDVSAWPFLKEQQDLIRACIDDLIVYGTEVLKIESEARRGRSASAKGGSKQRAPINFDPARFVKAYEKVSELRFRFGKVRIGPPIFFDYTLNPLGGETRTKYLLRFLEVCSRIHPGQWRRCLQCKKYFLQQRLLGKTKFCGRECRDEYNNHRPERRKGKRDLARKKRSEGDPRYFK